VRRWIESGPHGPRAQLTGASLIKPNPLPPPHHTLPLPPGPAGASLPLALSLLFLSIVALRGKPEGGSWHTRWMGSHSQGGLRGGSFWLSQREASTSGLDEEHFPSGTGAGEG